MLVKELIDLLKALPEESEIILAKDPEGNGYSPLSDIDSEVVYVPYNTWSGEIYSTKWSAEDAGMSEGEWKKLKENTSYVLLEPIN